MIIEIVSFRAKRGTCFLKKLTHTSAIIALLATLPTVALAQKPVRLTPAQIAQEVRDYRTNNEDRIIRELSDFLAIPNIASDTVNIQKKRQPPGGAAGSPRHRNASVHDQGSRPGHLRKINLAGSHAHHNFLRALRRPTGRPPPPGATTASRSSPRCVATPSRPAANAFHFRKTPGSIPQFTKTTGASTPVPLPTINHRSSRCWRRWTRCAQKIFRSR